MSVAKKPDAPKIQRFLIVFFSVSLTILLYWLLGFALDDIGGMPGPEYANVEKRHLDKQLIERTVELNRQIEDNSRLQNDQKNRQALLKDSTRSSQETMNQLQEMQKLSLQKGLKPSDAEQKALADSETLFLSNQQKYEQINEDLAKLTELQRSLQAEKRGIEEKLERQREPARKEFEGLTRRHEIGIGTLKLVLLIPLLLIVVFIYFKGRTSVYVPLISAAGIALLSRVTMVMHEYFPTRLFKYILIGVAIALVCYLLVYLIRMAAFPKKEWLLKKYRESYEKFFCPICGFPIRRGPHKYLFWSGRSVAKQTATIVSTAEGEKAYSCPSCGSTLHEKCNSCQSIRYALLPYCEHCGSEKEVTQQVK